MDLHRFVGRLVAAGDPHGERSSRSAEHALTTSPLVEPEGHRFHMTLYRVSQDQLVTYWWYAEADTAQQACLSDRNGVPDQAFSKLRRSETEASALPDGHPTEDRSRLVLSRWRVSYQVLAGVDGGQVASEGDVIVRALDEDIAVELAEEWITDNDPRHDDRIQPHIVIVSTDLIEPDSEAGQ
jgi:hypothetical protein